jgi:hypothetical protein
MTYVKLGKCIHKCIHKSQHAQLVQLVGLNGLARDVDQGGK